MSHFGRLTNEKLPFRSKVIRSDGRFYFLFAPNPGEIRLVCIMYVVVSDCLLYGELPGMVAFVLKFKLAIVALLWRILISGIVINLALGWRKFYVSNIFFCWSFFRCRYIIIRFNLTMYL